MSALSEKARRDLGKILGLLESEHAGERDAAIAAASRLLNKHGLRWCEILSEAPVPVVPEPRPEPPRERDPLNWNYLAIRCGEFPEYLNGWEQDFIYSLPRFPRISPKQEAILFRIVTRLRAMGAGYDWLAYGR